MGNNNLTATNDLEARIALMEESISKNLQMRVDFLEGEMVKLTRIIERTCKRINNMQISYGEEE